MKSTHLSHFFAAMTVLSLSPFAYGECAQEGGNQHGAPATDPYGPVASDPYDANQPVAPSAYASAQETAAAISAVVGSQAAPQARLTVVSPAEQSGNGNLSVAHSAPSARLKVIADVPRESLKPVADAVAAAVAKVTPAESAKPEDIATSDDNATIDEALKGLVGTWTAVARHGDGELTTVELQLDDRGWAKFTVPGPDGKPSTVKRRVELEDEELKLTGPDAELSLGKLIESNSRQMVLARADGKITFVRP